MFRYRGLGLAIACGGGTSLLFALVLFLWLGRMDGSYWTGLDLGKAGEFAEYCELNRFDLAIRQPVNAWSNLCYAFLGGFLLSFLPADLRRKHPMRLANAFVGLMLLGLCFGSFFYHASVTRIAQHFDMGFTYALSIGLLVAAIQQYLWPKASTSQIRLSFVLSIALSILMAVFKWALDGKIALPALMLGGTVMALLLFFRFKGKFQGFWMILALFFVVLSGIFRSIDLQKIGCWPEGIYQGHALWHLFTGLAAFGLMWFLRGKNQSDI